MLNYYRKNELISKETNVNILIGLRGVSFYSLISLIIISGNVYYFFLKSLMSRPRRRAGDRDNRGTLIE